MTGATLVVCRAENLFGCIKRQLEKIGFENVIVSGVEKDGLNMLIDELKPRVVLIDCKFYQCSTPYMVADLHKRFPDLYIAAVSVTDFPAGLAVYFIINGAKSYVNLFEGVEQFYEGLEAVRQGRRYISPEVQRLLERMKTYPDRSKKLTKRQVEIVKLSANGFTGREIADVLNISESTVVTQKRNIYASLCVRNSNEVIRAAIALGIINPEELEFFGNEKREQ